MDRHARWLRRRLFALIVTRIAIEAVVLGLTFAVGLVLLTVPFGLAVPWAAVLSQVFIAARVAHSVTGGPVGHAYVSHYIDLPLNFRPEPIEDGQQNPSLIKRDLFPVVRLTATTDDGEPQVEVYQATNRMVTAFLSEASGAIVFASRLVDNRIVLTSSQLIPPHESLVINYRPGSTPTKLLDNHGNVVKALATNGLRPVTSGPEIVVDSLKLEQEAYENLGPVFASLLAIDPSPSRFRLEATVRPAELRQLALGQPIPGQPIPGQPAPGPSESMASSQPVESDLHHVDPRVPVNH